MHARVVGVPGPVLTNSVNGDKTQEHLAERQTGVDRFDDFLKLSIDLTSDIWSVPQIAIQAGDRFAYARIIVSFGT